MRILFAGTPAQALPSLRRLIDSPQHERGQDTGNPRLDGTCVLPIDLCDVCGPKCPCRLGQTRRVSDGGTGLDDKVIEAEGRIKGRVALDGTFGIQKDGTIWAA